MEEIMTKGKEISQKGRTAGRSIKTDTDERKQKKGRKRR